MDTAYDKKIRPDNTELEEQDERSRHRKTEEGKDIRKKNILLILSRIS